MFSIIFGFHYSRIFTIIDGLKQYQEIKPFLEGRLNISESQIKKIKWNDLSHQLEKFLNLNSYELHKMLRKENIMIHIFDFQINKFIFSKLMEWNLFCIINPIIASLNHKNLDYQEEVNNLQEESEFLDTSREYKKITKLNYQKKSLSSKNVLSI